jgi:glycerol-3-phosphate dehydrogenase (NAD(P)+)
VSVELAGAYKNVVAIAAGACAGLDLGSNARAALITRGLAEMTRIGVAMGADTLTFSGLSGVGDLLLTCMSEQSRNFRVGLRIARGEPLDHILNTLGSVAEGVATTKAAYHLVQRLGVQAPITHAVHAVLYEGKDLKEAMHELMHRDPSHEAYGIIVDES